MGPLSFEQLRGIKGKTIEDVRMYQGIKNDGDIIIVLIFTDKTFTAYSPNPDEEIIIRFIKDQDMVIN